MSGSHTHPRMPKTHISGRILNRHRRRKRIHHHTPFPVPVQRIAATIIRKSQLRKSVQPPKQAQRRASTKHSPTPIRQHIQRIPLLSRPNRPPRLRPRLEAQHQPRENISVREHREVLHAAGGHEGRLKMELMQDRMHPIAFFLCHSVNLDITVTTVYGTLSPEYSNSVEYTVNQE
jgi:hypothetical protein